MMQIMMLWSKLTDVQRSSTQNQKANCKMLIASKN